MRKNWKKFEMVLLSIYFGAGLFTVLHHEPWRDEAHTWLLARDLPFFELFKHMGYEGTPALWSVLLTPLAKFNLPYFSLNFFHLLLATIAVAVFVLKAPFSKFTKIVFVFSYFMFWEYSVIARNYSISILLLFLIASCYRNRFLFPLRYAALVSLLFNTNAHSLLMAGALCLLFLYETYEDKAYKVNLPAVLVMVTGALAAFIQLLPPKDLMWGSNFFHVFHWKAVFISISNAFLPHALEYSIVPGVLLGMAIIVMAGYHFYKRTKKVFFLLLTSYLWLFYIFIFKYTGSVRHHGFLLVFLVFCIWLYFVYENPDSDEGILKGKMETILLMTFLNIGLMVSIVPGLIQHGREYSRMFSGAKEMAEFISENQLERYTIVAHSPPASSALLPYLPGLKFWYPSTKRFETYPVWNFKLAENMNLEIHEILNRIKKRGFESDRVLLLLNYAIPKAESLNFELVHQTKEEPFLYKTERFYLYRLPLD